MHEYHAGFIFERNSFSNITGTYYFDKIESRGNCVNAYIYLFGFTIVK
jgi:hypothetical protein